jgi:hypothetical protein
VTKAKQYKLKKQFEYLTSNIDIWEKMNQQEELFLMRLEDDFLEEKEIKRYKVDKLKKLYNKYKGGD